MNFTEEIMPPLADYGGGSGCGSLYFQDDRWPAPFNDMLLTCDWGRSEVFSHHLPQHGATYDAQQDTFLKIPRPTDADADASGRLFVTSWKNGNFAFERPDVGFVAMITPSNFVAHPAPDLGRMDELELVNELRHPSDALRLAAQRELLQRTLSKVAAVSDTSAGAAVELVPSPSGRGRGQGEGVSAAGDTQRFGARQAPSSGLRPALATSVPTQITQSPPISGEKGLLEHHLASQTVSVPDALLALAKDHSASLHSRVAALWTLRQISWDGFKAAFGSLLVDSDLREHAIRAAADRNSQIDKELIAPILSTLDDSNPRVLAAAIIAMGRMGAVLAAKKLLELTDRSSASGAASAPRDSRDVSRKADTLPLAEEGNKDAWRNPDPDRVIPHLAVKALVDLNAIDACLDALNGPHRAGPLAALKRMHDPRTIDGLFKILSTSRDEALRRDVWTTLIRLYHREGDFTVDSPKWWGTRPDTTGPYYDRQKWSESDRIATAIKVALAEGDDSLKAHISEQLKKHVVNLDGISKIELAMKEEEKAIVLPKANPNDPNAIANLAFDVVAQRASATPGDAAKGVLLFKQQSCINCHTFANGQQPKGPHLVDIGKRYKRAELIESMVLPSKKIAQGFDTWTFLMDDGKIYTGFVVLESAETVTLRDATGISRELIQDHIEERVKQEISMMPLGIVGNLSPEQLADLIAYLESLH